MRARGVLRRRNMRELPTEKRSVALVADSRQAGSFELHYRETDRGCLKEKPSSSGNATEICPVACSA